MPYKLSPDGLCVIKRDSGENVKCHTTHAEALAHLRALEINVEDAKTKDVSAVASPNNLHGPDSLLGIEGAGREKKKRKVETNAVATKENSGFLVSGEGGYHLPTRENGNVSHRLMGAAWAALHGGYRGNKYSGPSASGALSKLRALYKSEGIPAPDAEKAKVKAFDPYHSFHQFKQPDGRWRWVMTTSSGFRDRDSETIPTALLEADSTRMKSSGDYGPLRWHHVGSESANPVTRHPGNGLDIGACDFSEMHNHSQIESGLYADERIGDAFAPRLKELGGSKGYFYARIDPDTEGVYHKPIWGFERSVLPRESASNWMATAIKSLFHKEDAVNADAVMKLKSMLKPEDAHLVDDLLKGNDVKEGVLTDANVAVKAKKDDEAKEDPKEEATETAAEEGKEDKAEPDEKKKMKEAAFDTEALATALMTKMAGAFVTPTMLTEKFEALTSVATKSADESKVALKAHADKLDVMDVRLKALEGDTPESKRGYKASEKGGLDIMEGVLADFAKSQGLDVSKLGVKANQTPVSELDRITDRLAKEMMSGTAPIA